jgi:hypothetical protein
MLKITPSNNLIEFQLQVENASLDKTTARIILEVNNVNTIIPMEMDNDGKCTGEIPLKEEYEGKIGDIEIEIIADSTFFKPFTKKVIFEGIPKQPKITIKELKFGTAEKEKPVKPIKEVKVVMEEPKIEKHITRPSNLLSNKENNKLMEEVLKFFQNS